MADELTATIPDAEMAKLEAMAVEHDQSAEQELSTQTPEPVQPAAEELKLEGEIKPDNSETDPEIKKDERPRDELGRFTKTKDGQDIPEAERQPVEEKKPEQAETPYTKAKKEEERRDRSWKALEEEKKQTRETRAEVERWQQQLQREAAEIQRAREQRTTPNASQRQGTRYSSGELVEAANVFESNAEKAFGEGDEQAFKDNLALARNARQQAGEVYQQEQQAAKQQRDFEFQTLYSQYTDRTMEKEPELKNTESVLSKDVLALLEQEPVFSHVPDGFPKAVQVAKWKRDAGLVSELKDKLTKAEAEVQRLTKERTPLGAGPTTPIQAKNFDSLSTDDQMKQLERMAEQHDLAAA